MIDRDKLIEWLENVHKESKDNADRAGNHMVEGIALGKANLAYILITEIKKGTFMPEVTPIELAPFDFSSRIIG